MGWRKSKLESNNLNRPVLKKKKNYCKSDDQLKKQQKDKHEDVKKGLQNHRMWRTKIRKSRLFFFFFFFLILFFIFFFFDFME